jgi:alpha-1,6-mannosyltransferase
VKICDVTQFYSPVSGGVKRYITEKRRYVESHTDDEHYLVIPGAETKYVREGRLHLFTVQGPRIDPTSRYRILLHTNRVRDFLDEIRPDVIEAGDPYHLAWTCLQAGRALQVPVFGFYHSHFPEAYLRTVLKYCGPWVRDAVLTWAEDYITSLYSRFQNTLVPSDALREVLTEWGVDNAMTVKLGVDTASFCPGPRDDALRRSLGVEDDAFLLLYVGRLSGEKNVETMFRAFELLQENRVRKFHLLVIGDGPLRTGVNDLQSRFHQVTWIDYISDNATLARHYHCADLFVHPGVCETFGLVTLEAQSSGLVVCGIRGSRMDTNVFAGLDHWAGQNSPESLASAILDMSGLPLRELGEKASQEVRSHFSWEKVFQQLWSCYRGEAA